MPYTQECASCKAVLRIADFVRSPWLTCPRCLAKVMNPGSVAGASGAQECPQCKKKNSPKARRCIYCGGALGDEAAPAPAGRAPCPVCAEEIPSSATVCPLCLEPLTSGGRFRFADDDVDRDSTFIGRTMIPMAALGALGVFVFVGASEAMAPAVRPFLAILVGMIAVLGFVLSRMKENKAAQGFGRLILGGLAALGVVCAALFAFAIAAVVYFFVVCMSGGIH